MLPAIRSSVYSQVTVAGNTQPHNYLSYMGQLGCWQQLPATKLLRVWPAYKHLTNVGPIYYLVEGDKHDHAQRAPVRSFHAEYMCILYSWKYWQELCLATCIIYGMCLMEYNCYNCVMIAGTSSRLLTVIRETLPLGMCMCDGFY